MFKDWKCSLCSIGAKHKEIGLAGIVIERVSAWSYRINTVKGGIYVRNRKKYQTLGTQTQGRVYRL